MPPGVSVISRYKLFWKSGSYDITSGRVNLDLSGVCLGGHAHVWCHKSQIFKMAYNG